VRVSQDKSQDQIAGPEFTSISAGNYHNLALRSDGKVIAWGGNSANQSIVPENLINVIAISAGGAHSLALKKDGSVVAWGSDRYGQSTVPENLSSIIAISAGETHSLALQQDGSVVAWGSNDYGESSVPPGLQDVKGIAAGAQHSIAVKTDGSVVAWGRNERGQNHVPENLSGVIAIADGSVCGLALKSDGTVVDWGYCSEVQGSIDKPEDLANVTAISAASDIWSYRYYALALKDDGTVVYWGRSRAGECVGPIDGLKDVAAISAGEDHTLVLMKNGSLAAFGENDFGQSILPGDFPVTALSTSFSYASPCERPFFRTLIIRMDGAIVGWDGDRGRFCRTVYTVNREDNGSEKPDTLVAAFAGSRFNEFLTQNGHLMYADWQNQSLPLKKSALVPDDFRIVSVSVGEHNILILAENGTVLCHGRTGDCNLPAGLINVSAISAGSSHWLALKDDGTVVTWGYRTGQYSIPENHSKIVAISAGGEYSLALQDDGKVLAWGDNSSAQLSVPQHQGKIIGISAGDTHSLALTDDGKVIAWGSNTYQESNVPKNLYNVTSVAAGLHQSYAIRKDGSVIAWGTIVIPDWSG